MDALKQLADTLRSQLPAPGFIEFPETGLMLGRADAPTAPQPCVYGPSIVVVAQGDKRAHMGGGTIDYGEKDYLVCTLTLPIESEILTASPERPFLVLVLPVDVAVVSTLLVEMGDMPIDGDAEVARAALQTCAPCDGLLVALHRLLVAVADPQDRRVLAPQLVREVSYMVLRGPQGALLRDYALRDSSAHRIAGVVRFLSERYREPMTIEAITRHAGMSASALHHHFKAATTQSPLQFVKRLRLHRARSLLVTGTSAGDAAYEVGYSSPSQFSREFRRLFGVTPSSLRGVHEMAL